MERGDAAPMTRPPSNALRCCVTGRVAEGKPGKTVAAKLPMGWARFGGQVYSPEGWRETFVERGLRVSVASVLAVESGRRLPPLDTLPWDDAEATASSWKEFRRCLGISWQQYTQAANWMLRRLASSDLAIPVRDGAKTTLPPPKFTGDLYNEARQIFAAAGSIFVEQAEDHLDAAGQLRPGMDATMFTILTKQAREKYIKTRWYVYVTAKKSFPSFRDGELPLPLRADNAILEVLSDGTVCIVSRIAGTRFVVRLKNDPARFGRNLRPIREAAVGNLSRGDVKLSDNDGQVIATVSVSLRRDLAPRKAVETLVVRTDPHALLVAELSAMNGAGDVARTWPCFVLNEDELKRWWIAGKYAGKRGEETLKGMVEDHLAYLQRMGQDRKAETRSVRRWKESRPPLLEGPRDDELSPAQRKRRRKYHRKNMQRSLESRCAKHARRIADRLHKIACVVVNHAVRRGVASVFYDDSCREYLPRFPYYRLKALIREKLDYRGIAMACKAETDAASGEVVNETPGPARESEPAKKKGDYGKKKIRQTV